MVFTGHDANTVRTATVTLMVAAGLRPEYTAGIDQWTWKVDAMRMRGMRKESKELSLSALLALCVLLAVSAVWPALAEEVRNRDGVAVIIGNKDYRHERVPEVAYARRDAEAFGRYVVDVLGFDPNRVFELPNATQADMFSWFGNRGSHEGKLWRYLHPRRGSDVVVFYSGHGVPGLKDRRGYLLPSDADPNTAEINGYPIDLLYENLGKLAEATSVRVFLDACFSGDSDQGFLVRSASPVFVQASLPGASGEKLTVLSAASGTEVASWDEKAQHGMFTHYLLDALYGKGDADGDGKVTAREAKIYLDDHMTYAARLAFGADVESGLGLTRGDRRSIQSGLASLGFAAGPADGLFGKRTRDAISSWQEAKGEEPTGYLTRTEAEALKAAGEEARRAAAERERKAHAAAEAQRRAKAEEARKARARRAETSTHGREFDDCGGAGWCPRMVVLPAGSFTMGSPSSEKGRERDEGPQHVVTIPRPFAVGKYEVTFEEWDACVRGGGCPHRLGDKGWGRGRRPVINVSWKDAQDYVRWLSRETGKEYRLLTEAEWEYAARAGTTGPV